MKLRYPFPLNVPAARKSLVDLLSATIQARRNDTFEPYCPNEHDDTYWTLDSGNDWKVQFGFDPDPCVFNLRYRYEAGTPKEAALAGWLVARVWGMEVVA